MKRNDPPQMAARAISLRKLEADMAGSRRFAPDMVLALAAVAPLLAVCQSDD